MNKNTLKTGFMMLVVILNGCATPKMGKKSLDKIKQTKEGLLGPLNQQWGEQGFVMVTSIGYLISAILLFGGLVMYLWPGPALNKLGAALALCGAGTLAVTYFIAQYAAFIIPAFFACLAFYAGFWVNDNFNIEREK